MEKFWQNTANVQDMFFNQIPSFIPSTINKFNTIPDLSIKSSDYDLFKYSRNYDLILKKYDPLLKSMASKYYQNRKKDNAIGYMDLYQDNICYAIKAINYVNFSMIDENFKFGSILVDYLTGYNNSECKKEATVVVQKQFSVDYNNSQEISSYYETKDIKNTKTINMLERAAIQNGYPNFSVTNMGADKQYEEKAFRDHFEEFRMTLNPLERTILEETERGTMLKDISKLVRHNTEANTAYYKIKMKNKFKSFMKEKGYFEEMLLK